MEEEKKDVNIGVILAIIMALIIIISILYFTGCKPPHPNPPEKPTPTPTPQKTEVSWQDGQLCINGKPERLILWGDYWILNRYWTDLEIHEYCAYFAKETPFNGFRVFPGYSTFSKDNVQSVGLQYQTIFPKLPDGKYDVYNVNQEWLVYLDKWTRIAGEHGLVVMYVLYEHCGFKSPSWSFSSMNPDNSNARWEGYDGSAYWKGYHSCDYTSTDKFDELCQEWEMQDRNVAQAVCRNRNVIFELSNEGVAFHYDSYRYFMRKQIEWITDQYAKNGYSAPVFTDSTDGFSCRDMVQIQWSHEHLADTPYNMSTDGDRYYKHTRDDLVNRYQYIKNTGKHFEFHLSFIAEQVLPGQPVHSFLWGTRPAKIQDYRNVLKPYFDEVSTYVK